MGRRMLALEEWEMENIPQLKSNALDRLVAAGKSATIAASVPMVTRFDMGVVTDKRLLPIREFLGPLARTRKQAQKLYDEERLRLAA